MRHDTRNKKAELTVVESEEPANKISSSEEEDKEVQNKDSRSNMTKVTTTKDKSGTDKRPRPNWKREYDKVVKENEDLRKELDALKRRRRGGAVMRWLWSASENAKHANYADNVAVRLVDAQGSV